MIIDLRNHEHKSDDLQGKSSNTMNENSGFIISKPHIVSCTSRENIVTLVSLTHHPMLNSIILIMKNPQDRSKTLIRIFNDKRPYDKKQEIIYDIESYYSISSIDRRSNDH